MAVLTVTTDGGGSYKQFDFRNSPGRLMGKKGRGGGVNGSVAGYTVLPRLAARKYRAATNRRIRRSSLRNPPTSSSEKSSQTSITE